VIKYRFDEEIRELLVKIDLSQLFYYFNHTNIDLIYSSLSKPVLKKIQRAF
jgi:hypothetical protein